MKKIDFNSKWNNIPEQVKRLTFVLVLVLAALLTARYFFVPKDFGKYGHFRAAAVDEIVSQNIQYGGQKSCFECHDDIMEIKNGGYHKTVSCEVCHGPAAAHSEDSESVELLSPRERGYCPICHEYLPSRPTGFPQIVAASHNPMKPCISCHDPHDPKPPQAPKECEACHAGIARTKSFSRHVYLPCIRCHETPKEHKIYPRQYIPDKPQTREFCGSCHAIEALVEKEISRIDLSTHEERYMCWQCHYPHLPEVK